MKTFVLISLVGSIHGHVILTIPRSRNFLASFDGGNTAWPWETCPHCLNDGGVGNVQLAQQQLTGVLTWQGYPETAAFARRHSVCGGNFVGDNKYDDNGDFSPLSNSYVGVNKGAWGQASSFAVGSVISLEVEVRAHHQGHFEFSICNKADQEPGADTSAECLNQHRLQRAPDLDGEVSPTDPNYPERYYMPPPCALLAPGDGQLIVENMRFQLPEDLSCEHCVLQLVYVASNSCNPDGYHEHAWPDISQTCPRSNDDSARWWTESLVNCADGSYPEEFWNCADIRIQGAEGGGDTLPPVSMPSSMKPTTTLSPTVREDDDDGGSGPLVIVGIITEPSREDAGTAHPVTFSFFDAAGGLIFTTLLGALPASGMSYEEYLPDVIAKGSTLLDGVEVAFGELCVQEDLVHSQADALIVSRRETYVWVGDVQYVSGCASPHTKLRVEPGECKRFPMLPAIFDAETAAPSIPGNDATPAPPTSAPPTPLPSSNPAPTSSPPSPATYSPTLGSGSDLPASPQCDGEPCDNNNFCRSKWGWCGEGGSYCNDESTWMPSCAESIPQPTPQPPPTASPPTSQPSPTTSPQSSSPPSSPPSSGRLGIGSTVKGVLQSNAASFTNDILLYQKPTNEWEPSTVYQFDDMVVALEKMWTSGIGTLQLYLGDDVEGASGERAKQYALVNIAAFLAQSMQETIQYNACDENSWDLVGERYPLSNSCGQLGQSYQDYQCSAAEAHMACEVDSEQALTATTNAKWYGAPAPLFCGPKTMYPETGFWDHAVECNKPWADPPETCDVYTGQKAGGFDNSVPHGNFKGRTDVEGCCFWGRGVIQTTGVCNFGKLNFFLGERADTEGRNALYPDVNFCKRPDLICDENSGHPELKWIAGLFYWMESVQRYDEGGWSYLDELRIYVDAGMPNVGNDSGFIHAVSGIVNRGCHSPPCDAGALHAGSERARNFRRVLQAMQLV